MNINYRAREAPVHVGERGSEQRMEHFAATKKMTRCSAFTALQTKARLFFHLETFCLTTADQQPKIPQKQIGGTLAEIRAARLYPGVKAK